MCGFSKKRLNKHKATSVAVVLLYIFIVLAVHFFHNHKCKLTQSGSPGKKTASCDSQCPACKFLAGYNSTEADDEPALFSPENILISHFMPRGTIELRDNWTSSIISRGPPSTTIS